MARRSRSTAIDQTEMLGALGDQIADRFGIDRIGVRYVEVTFHNGERWTKCFRWERVEKGRWLAVEDFPGRLGH